MLVVAVAGCTPAQPIERLQGFTQGTTYHLQFWSPSPVDVEAVQSEVTDELQQIDDEMSDYRPDSVIARFNAYDDTAPHAVGRAIVELVERARQVS